MQSWKSIELTHEGFPLFLRYPEKLDLDSLRSKFPTLVVITHHLSKVKPNGVPDADYNDTLFQFDSDIRTAFESPIIGVTTFIETFGGKRNYYIYVIPETDVARAISVVMSSNPNEKITWTVHTDPGWSFFEKYSKEYLR